jgi:hypothetical protein
MSSMLTQQLVSWLWDSTEADVAVPFKGAGLGSISALDHLKKETGVPPQMSSSCFSKLGA